MPAYCTSTENLSPRSGTSFHIGARGAPRGAGLPAYFINVKSRNGGLGPFNPGKISPHRSVQALRHLANLRRSMLYKEKIILLLSLYWAPGPCQGAVAQGATRLKLFRIESILQSLSRSVNQGLPIPQVPAGPGESGSNSSQPKNFCLCTKIVRPLYRGLGLKWPPAVGPYNN